MSALDKAAANDVLLSRARRHAQFQRMNKEVGRPPGLQKWPYRIATRVDPSHRLSSQLAPRFPPQSRWRCYQHVAITFMRHWCPPRQDSAALARNISSDVRTFLIKQHGKLRCAAVHA